MALKDFAPIKKKKKKKKKKKNMSNLFNLNNFIEPSVTQGSFSLEDFLKIGGDKAFKKKKKRKNPNWSSGGSGSFPCVDIFHRMAESKMVIAGWRIFTYRK